jgi:hypothetical protein
MQETVIKPLKQCRHCNVAAYTEKDLELFKKDKRFPFGRDNQCKECINKKRRVNKELVRYLVEDWHQTGFGIMHPKIVEAWTK